MSRPFIVHAGIMMIWSLLNMSYAFAESPLSEGETQRIELSIKKRQIQLETNSVRVSQGDKVELVWTSDEPVSLHLHGYDLELNVGPQEAVTQTFLAYATGRFPITSHSFSGESKHGHQALLYLEVYPK